MRKLLVLLGSLMCASCVAVVEDNGDSSGSTPESESVGVLSAELDTSWSSLAPFHVDPDNDVRLEADSTHVCVLTRVSGHFAGWAEEVRLYRSGGYWRLSVQSNQEGVSGEAWCFKKNGFLANGTARWVGGGDDAWYINGYIASDACGVKEQDLWAGDATTFVAGISGEAAGGCEYVSIRAASSATTNARLQVASGGTNTIDGWAAGFFAGTPGAGRAAKFYSGTTFTARNSTVDMAPTNQAMCHFTKIGGDFNGGGEYVEIKPGLNQAGVEVWKLTAHHQSGNGIDAKARCYMRDQR